MCFVCRRFHKWEIRKNNRFTFEKKNLYAVCVCFVCRRFHKWEIQKNNRFTFEKKNYFFIIFCVLCVVGFINERSKKNNRFTFEKKKSLCVCGVLLWECARVCDIRWRVSPIASHKTDVCVMQNENEWELTWDISERYK